MQQCAQGHVRNNKQLDLQMDALNLASDLKKNHTAQKNRDKLPSSDLLSTLMHPPSQWPWHESAGESTVGQAPSYPSKGTMAS